MPVTLMQGATPSYTRSVAAGPVHGAGDRATDRDGVHQQGTAAPLSTIGSQGRKQEASGAQQQQTETAWSLLGKMYSSQVLAYMVAITDAQALVKRMRAMRPGEGNDQMIPCIIGESHPANVLPCCTLHQACVYAACVLSRASTPAAWQGAVHGGVASPARACPAAARLDLWHASTSSTASTTSRYNRR